MKTHFCITSNLWTCELIQTTNDGIWLTTKTIYHHHGLLIKLHWDDIIHSPNRFPSHSRPAWTGRFRVLLCSRMPMTPPQQGVDPVVYSASAVISGDTVGHESTGRKLYTAVGNEFSCSLLKDFHIIYCIIYPQTHPKCFCSWWIQKFLQSVPELCTLHYKTRRR